MVDDLLTLARIDEQRPLKPKPADLLMVGNDAALDTQASDRARDHPDRARRRAPRTGAVRGDEAKLRQVVANLVGNALRYTPEGTPMEIAVGVRTAGDGAGSPSSRSATMAPVFRKRRPHGSSNASTARTLPAPANRRDGLGLAMSGPRGAHAGTVRLAKTDGGGATLSVSLPFLDEAPDDDRVELPAVEPAGDRQSGRRRREVARPRSRQFST